MQKYTVAAFSMICLLAATNPGNAATFEWVNGPVTSVTAQEPKFTVFIVGQRSVRFCDEHSGSDYPVTSENPFFDLLKSAMFSNKNVQVGVQNFGRDPAAGDDKRCIDRVIVTR
jgi:hypothetical protein